MPRVNHGEIVLAGPVGAWPITGARRIKSLFRQLVTWYRTREVEQLEAQIVSELRVVGVLFGDRPAKHLEWADATIWPPEYVAYYMQSWRLARTRAWQRLVRLSTRLLDLTHESHDEWTQHLHRLERLTGADIPNLLPITQRMLFFGSCKGRYSAASRSKQGR